MKFAPLDYEGAVLGFLIQLPRLAADNGKMGLSK